MVLMLMMWVGIMIVLGYLSRKSDYISVFNIPRDEGLDKSHYENTLIQLLIMIILYTTSQVLILWRTSEPPTNLLPVF